ncbi:glycosyltransferase [Puia sp. P3]|uniref:glycosyltransferase n=1 Tax=Puia sp. P3 TaxID=3423952 RepID=UPI003D67AEB6
MAGIDTVIYTPNGAPFFVGNNSFSNFLYKQLERLGTIFGGRVVCCSPSELKAYNAIGIKALNINNGVDIEERPLEPLPRLSNTGIKTRYPGLRSGKFRIVTSGRIEDQKNPTLFNTIAKYFEEFHDFEFLWIGEGADREMLTSKNIVITGWLSTEDTKDLIAASQVYLSTSTFEGLPFAVLEALALKKPVLLTDCVGNRDIVNKRLNGDLFTSEDEAIIKILQYHNNRDMLQIMGEYSQQHCEQEFDVYSTFTSYRSLYKS